MLLKATRLRGKARKRERYMSLWGPLPVIRNSTLGRDEACSGWEACWSYMHAASNSIPKSSSGVQLVLLTTMAGRPARQRTVPLCCCMLSAHTGGDGCAASASGVVAAPAAAASCIPSWDPGGCACHCCFAPCCPAAGAASSPPTCLRPTLGPSAVACALTQLPLRSKLQLWCGPRSVMAVLDPPDVWVPRRPAEEPSWMVVAAGAVILVVVAMVLTRCAASCWCTWCHVDKKSWKLGSSRAGVSFENSW
mmetsp:Transcript_3869/g.8966  ORF Transcript_3869/g.8966 Transcript_3869/m.8966 type:complete len:250 (-) Transcript_3869:399-1148(-)